MIKTIGFLTDSGKIVKTKAGAKRSNVVRAKNKLTNQAKRKGWKVSKL